MANNYFFYPTVSGATATLNFDTAGHLLDGSDFALIPNMQTGVSKGGTRYAESFGPDRQTFDFSFLVPESSSTVSDRADVITFFASVLGATNTFVWRDENATDRTVRCISDQIRFRRVGIYWRVTVTLEVQ